MKLQSPAFVQRLASRLRASFWFTPGWIVLLSMATAAALVPVGVAGVYIGLWLQRRVNAKLFYTLIYAFLLLTGLKLFYDGLRAIF